MEAPLLSQIISARQFEILRLRFAESGYTWKDIAINLGVCEATIRADYASAAKAIRSSPGVRIDF